MFSNTCWKQILILTCTQIRHNNTLVVEKNTDICWVLFNSIDHWKSPTTFLILDILITSMYFCTSDLIYTCVYIDCLIVLLFSLTICVNGVDRISWESIKFYLHSDKVHLPFVICYAKWTLWLKSGWKKSYSEKHLKIRKKHFWIRFTTNDKLDIKYT